MNNMRATFLMIARILYDKGYKEYTHAARIIRGKYPEARFELLGKIDQEYPNHVPESVVRHDHAEGVIHYLGFVSDVREIIRQADCIVLPTYYNEGLSRVLMEAMALRKSIITTNIPGCKETVEEGRNGFLVPPRDVDALAQAMECFIRLPEEERIKMGKYSREKAEREFDIRNVIAIYRKITG